MSLTLHHFDDLLAAARAQPQPQRLLMVFAEAELPADATPAQRQAFEAGEGGTLNLLMAVDKRPDEISNFASLADEARRAGPPWQLLFAAALSGSEGRQPADAEVDHALERMAQRIQQGELSGFVPFDAQGNVVTGLG